MDARHHSELLEAKLLVNGCPAVAPRVDGAGTYDWEAGFRSHIALTALPDGELDLTLSAFGQQAFLPLLKRGKTITYLRAEEKSGYINIPADPTRGHLAIAVFADANCRAGDQTGRFQ